MRSCLLLGLVALLSGCASTSARPVSTYSGPGLGRPARVFVVDFAVSPNQVSLNGGALESGAGAVDGVAPDPDQLKVRQEVAAVLSEDLVKRIGELGFVAERAPAGKQAAPGTMVIEGQFVTIDEGSRFKRMVIGFGAGGSVVKTVARVYIGAPSGPTLVQTFETEAKSAATPGLLVGGPAVAAGRLVVAGAVAAAKMATEVRKGVANDAERTAEELAKRLGEFFVEQGWVPKDAIN